MVFRMVWLTDAACYEAGQCIKYIERTIVH
jgi:hypothetical protein